MGKKKFDKKNAFTFRLVHRGQTEMTAFDDGVSPYVLEPISGPRGSRPEDAIPGFVVERKAPSAAAAATTSTTSAARAPQRAPANIYDDADEDDEDADHSFVQPPSDSVHHVARKPRPEMSKKAREIRNIKAALRNQEFDVDLDFPDDGYDYSKHIRTPGSGTFLPRAGLENFFTAQQHKRDDERDHARYHNNDEPDEDVDDSQLKFIVPRRVVALDDALEREYLDEAFHDPSLDPEVMAALEEDGDDANAEELLDDFVVTAAGDQFDNADEDDDFDGDFDDAPELEDADDDDGGDGGEIDEASARILREAMREYMDGNDYEYTIESDDDGDDDYNDNSDAYTTASSMTRAVMRATDARRRRDDDTLGYKPQDDWVQPRRGKVIYVPNEQVLDEMEAAAAAVPDTVLDQQFERMMEQFDDEEIGELDAEDPTVRGGKSINQFAEVLDSFLVDSEVTLEKVTRLDPEIKQLVLDQLKRKPEYEYVLLREKIEDGWDCESVTSIYTNTENHPALIIESGKPARKIKLSKKTGAPILDASRTAASVAGGSLDSDDDDETMSTTSTNLGIARRKDETPEERRERKNMAKEAKRQRRLQKKNLKVQFKKEEIRQAATEVQVQKFPTGVRF